MSGPDHGRKYVYASCVCDYFHILLHRSCIVYKAYEYLLRSPTGTLDNGPWFDNETVASIVSGQAGPQVYAFHARHRLLKEVDSDWSIPAGLTAVQRIGQMVTCSLIVLDSKVARGGSSRGIA